MNRPFRLAFALCAALVAAACSGDTTGDACTETTDCQTGQTCYTDLPQGYCSKGCTDEGTDRACGSGTVCSQTATRMLCAVTCEGNDDCRTGYACLAVAGSSLKSCQPRR